MPLASPEMQARQKKNRDRQPTPHEVAGLVDGSLYLCSLCGDICAKAWSDEEAEAEHVRNFAKPSNVRDNGSGEDSMVCDPCYQEVASHYRLERSH